MADIFLDVSNNFEKAKSSWNKLTGAVSRSSGEFKGFTNNVNRTQGALRNLNTDANRSVTAFGNLSSAVSKINMAGTYYIIERLAALTSRLVQTTVDQTEIVNMFSVAMGDLADETGDYLEKISQNTGIDLTNLEEAVGTYNTLARSMGISSENAQVLSTSVTQLAYDLSSLFNIPFKQVLADLKSGLIGQTETVYKYGIDLTEASLKQSDLAKTMGKSVREMTQGEKMLARYDLMLKQTGLSMGDFTRTIGTPANQLRVLGENVLTLGRAIGSALYPALAAVLPLIRGVVMALTVLFQLLGSIAGYVTPKAKDMTNGFSDVSGAIDDATGSAGGLQKALDKIKAPFDELNVVDDTQSGGGGGGAGVAGITSDMLDGLKAYSTLMNEVNDKAKSIRDNILEWLGFIKEINPITGDISWKLGEGYTNIEKIRDALIGVGIAILAIKTAILMVKGFQSVLTGLAVALDMLGYSNLKASIETMGFGKSFANLFPKLTAAVPYIAAVTAALVVCAIRLNHAYQTSEEFRTGVKVLGDALNKLKEIVMNLGEIIETALINVWNEFIKSEFGQQIVKIIQPAIEAISKFNEVLDEMGLSFYDVITMMNPLLDPLNNMIVAVKQLGFAFSPAIESTDLFAEGVSEATAEALKPFITEMDSLKVRLDTMDFSNSVVSDTDVTEIKTRLETITKNIKDVLSVNESDSYKLIDALKQNLRPQDYAGITSSVNEYYAKKQQIVADGEARINEIMEAAKNAPNGGRALTEEESAEINRIYAEMYQTGIQELSQNEIDYTTIMRRLKDNATALSTEQASEIIKNALQTKNDTISAAEEQYSRQLLEAQKMREAGAISVTEYDRMVKAATDARDSTIRDAETQYSSILKTTQTKLGEAAQFIDTTTGEIKTKWDIFTGNLSNKWNTEMDVIKTKVSTIWEEIKTFWNTNIAILFTADFWTAKISVISGALTALIQTVVRSVATLVESGVNTLIDGLNLLSFDLPEPLGGKHIGFDISHISINKPMISGKFTARGGILEGGDMFVAGELGKYEVAGNYMGKTTVMPLEDTGFVEAMYKAVLNAVTDAGGKGGSVIENVINLDGEVIYRNQQKVSSSRGVNLGMGVFAR